VSDPIIFTDIEQGTPEWFAARAGLPTASEFQCVLSPRAGKEGKMRQTYLRRLAGEIVTGEPYSEGISNVYTERGKEMEAKAREYYELVATGDELQRVGFVRLDTSTGPVGCSPDALVGDDGGLEIKTTAPHLLIEHLIAQKNDRDYFPPQYYAQCQGFLYVTGRDWVDLCVYWPKMPAMIARTYPSEAYQEALDTALKDFNRDLTTMVDLLRSM
jgi:hypothetical protein